MTVRGVQEDRTEGMTYLLRLYIHVGSGDGESSETMGRDRMGNDWGMGRYNRDERLVGVMPHVVHSNGVRAQTREREIERGVMASILVQWWGYSPYMRRSNQGKMNRKTRKDRQMVTTCDRCE